MKYFVYIIYSSRFNRFYVGMTNNLERRLSEHNCGSVKPTKAYVPWKVVHSEVFHAQLEARVREKYFKSGSGREFRNKMFKN